MKLPVQIFLAALVVVGLAGAATGQGTSDRVNLRLSWIGSGEYAMYPYATKKGIFATDRIDLQVLEGNGSTPASSPSVRASTSSRTSICRPPLASSPGAFRSASSPT